MTPPGVGIFEHQRQQCYGARNREACERPWLIKQRTILEPAGDVKRKIQDESVHQEQLGIRRPADSAHDYKRDRTNGIQRVWPRRSVALAEITQHFFATSGWEEERGNALEPIEPIHPATHFLPPALAQSLPHTATMPSQMRLAVTADSSSARSPRASRR